MEFQRIADEILEHLGELNGIDAHRRQPVIGDPRVTFVDRDLEPVEHVLQHDIRSYDLGCFGLRVDAGIGEQILDKLLHALGALDGIGDVFLGLLVDFALVMLGQQFSVARDHAQRLLQVMRRDISELLQIGVRAL